MKATAALPLALLLAAGVLPAGCVTETHLIGPGGRVEEERRPDPDDDDEPLRKEPEPGTYVEVPASVALPVQTFFDYQGFLVADVIEIDCSWQPYMSRFVTLSKIVRVAESEGTAEDGGIEVQLAPTATRTDRESEDGSVYRVEIDARDVPAHMESLMPRVSFASRLLPDERTRSAAAPSFEIVATQRMVVHFHTKPDPERPSWFRLHARGTPSARDPSRPRSVSYFNTHTMKKVRSPEVEMRLEVVHRDGRWVAIIREPGDR